VDGLACIQKNFELYSEFNREPMKLLQNWGDVMK